VILDGAGSWDYTVLATPALVDGILVVPTQYDDLVALDVDDGAELWRHTASPGVLHDAHSRVTSSSFPSSPVVAGDTVWVIAGDGRLDALDPRSGASRGAVELGVPGNAGLAAAGEILLAATYDGTLRAMVHDPCIPEAGDEPPEARASGCGCLASGEGDWLLLVGIAAAGSLVHRRRCSVRSS
jgi:outer membrane protein assembly factor BamB